MNYTEAEEYLKELNKYGSVPGLDSIRNLLGRLGNPEKELSAVHVAGTNGKGSTIAFLQSILMHAGYTVGRYSSPAVFDSKEIIQINNENIEEENVADLVFVIKEKCDEIVEEGLAHPTVFEVETAMAFLYFKEKKCDIVLIECGMGGKEDATNVFDKVLCSVITSISLDHTKVLGRTIKDITKQKAGIIKEGCPVVMSQQGVKAVHAAANVARKQNAPFTIANKTYDIETKKYKTYFVYEATNEEIYEVELGVLGTYQPANAATAIEVALVLEQCGYRLKEHITEGLKTARWHGRMEIISENPLIVIDGAHNPDAVKELRKSIDLYFTNKRITYIMGVLADKDFKREAQLIADRGKYIITVTPNNDRGLDGGKLAKTLGSYNDNVISARSVEEAVRMAEQTVYEGEADMILAFGSLSYLGEVKKSVEKQTVKAERRD